MPEDPEVESTMTPQQLMCDHVVDAHRESYPEFAGHCDGLNDQLRYHVDSAARSLTRLCAQNPQPGADLEQCADALRAALHVAELFLDAHPDLSKVDWPRILPSIPANGDVLDEFEHPWWAPPVDVVCEWWRPDDGLREHVYVKRRVPQGGLETIGYWRRAKGVRRWALVEEAPDVAKVMRRSLSAWQRAGSPDRYEGRL